MAWGTRLDGFTIQLVFTCMVYKELPINHQMGNQVGLHINGTSNFYGIIRYETEVFWLHFLPKNPSDGYWTCSASRNAIIKFECN